MQRPDESTELPPPVPYFSVIFTSRRTEVDPLGYQATAERMLQLAQMQDGYLGVESVRDESGLGITVSYWRDLEAIRRWHEVAEHQEAQKAGREKWYESFVVRICRVERQYDFGP